MDTRSRREPARMMLSRRSSLRRLGRQKQNMNTPNNDSTVAASTADRDSRSASPHNQSFIALALAVIVSTPSNLNRGGLSHG